jgi:hypothetical protein
MKLTNCGNPSSKTMVTYPQNSYVKTSMILVVNLSKCFVVPSRKKKKLGGGLQGDDVWRVSMIKNLDMHFVARVDLIFGHFIDYKKIWRV